MSVSRRWSIWGLASAGALVVVAVGGSLSASSAGNGSEAVFVPVTPCRLVDTRPAPLNVGPRDTPIGEDDPVAFTAWGSDDGNSVCDLPETATAISTNTTIVNPTSASFLTLYPFDADRPGSSNLNYGRGQPATANAVTTPLSPLGQFAVYNRFGTVDVIVDVNGFFQPSSSVGAQGPTGPEGPTGPQGEAGPTASAMADVRSFNGVDVPQTSSAVMISLDPDEQPQPVDGDSSTTGLIELHVPSRLMATVMFRLEPTGGAVQFGQCRLYFRAEGNDAISAMTRFIPRTDVPAEGATFSQVGATFNPLAAGNYEVMLRCLAGAGGTSAPAQATMTEAQLIVWAVAA